MSEIVPNRPRPRKSLARLLPAFYLVGGVVLGLGLAAAWMSRQEPSADPKATLPSEPALQTPEQKPEPKEDPPTSENKAPETPPTQAPASPNQATPPATTAAPPPLQGTISGGPSTGMVPPVNPIVIGGEDGPPEPKVSFKEIMVIALEADIPPAIQRVRGAAGANRGQVLSEFILDPDFPERGTDLLISIPKASAAKFLEDVLKIGSAQETDDWTGPHSERLSRMQRFYRESAQKLDSRLKQLLVKYLDDAPEVVRTQQTLERFRRAQNSIRTLPDDREAFRVFIGKSPPSV